MVFIEGRLQTSKYQNKDGQDRTMAEVLVRNLTLLGSQNSSYTASGDASTRDGQAPKGGNQTNKIQAPDWDFDDLSTPTEDDMPPF
jgi:single-stranded DNA-binding protein